MQIKNTVFADGKPPPQTEGQLLIHRFCRANCETWLCADLGIYGGPVTNHQVYHRMTVLVENRGPVKFTEEETKDVQSGKHEK